MKITQKITIILCFLVLVACSSKPKKTFRTEQVSLGQDDFVSLYFNLIEIKNDENKEKEYIVNAAFSFEAMPNLEIYLDENKPLFISIDSKVQTLKPIKNKYQHIVKKVSSGKRVLHIQKNDYQISKATLLKISKSKTTVVKIPAKPHMDFGFDGVFRKEGLEKISEFIK